MMAEYKAILIFKDCIDSLCDLSDSDFRSVILKYTDYVIDGEYSIEDCSPSQKIALRFMTSSYDRNTERKKKESERVRKYQLEHNANDVNSVIYSNLQKNTGITHQEKEIKKEIEIENISKERLERKSKPFSPPSLEDVQAYCKERHSSVDPQKFFEFYQEGNWKDSKGNPVRNWKQKLITWESKENKKEESSSHQDDEWDDFMKAAFNKFLEG